MPRDNPASHSARRTKVDPVEAAPSRNCQWMDGRTDGGKGAYFLAVFLVLAEAARFAGLRSSESAAAGAPATTGALAAGAEGLAIDEPPPPRLALRASIRSMICAVGCSTGAM